MVDALTLATVLNAGHETAGGKLVQATFRSPQLSVIMELSELTDKAIDYMLSELADSNNPKLTDWEKNTFIPNIVDQWERKRWLSDKQKQTLGRIWDKV